MQKKEDLRRQIAADTEVFLKAGGVIKTVPPVSVLQIIADLKDIHNRAAYDYRSRTFSNKAAAKK